MIDFVVNGVRPHYLETVEESLNDTATILASLVETNLKGERIHYKNIQAAMLTASRRTLNSTIYLQKKVSMDLLVYITDAQGRVLYDSNHGLAEGRDYSRWNDVYKTLRGQYGARSTRLDPLDDTSGAYYVAAPIRRGEKIVGVLTVIKPKRGITPFIKEARRKILYVSIGIFIAFILMGVLITRWITRPLALLTGYVEDLRNRKRVKLPRLGRTETEISLLGKTFERMRTELEGKQYVEQYVQTFTHELKSPLSSIAAAAELLEEEMTPLERKKFIGNIRSGASRIQGLVDRMLLLSSLENRRELKDVNEFDLRPVCEEVLEEMGANFKAANLLLESSLEESLNIRGEEFLIRQALVNLLQNALEFTPAGGLIRVRGEMGAGRVRIQLQDTGTGIPDYAREKIFDRFYSLGRPAGGRRSSGLGLSFVREVAELHGGYIQVANRPEGGVSAEFVLPGAGKTEK